MENRKSKILGIDFIEFWCGNTNYISSYFCNNYGFYYIASKENESFRISKLISQQNIKFIFTSSISSQDNFFYNFFSLRGDSIRDIAFQVNNVEVMYEEAILNGAIPLEPPHIIEDENGKMIIAKIGTPYGDLVHSLVDRSNYHEIVLPEFKIHNNNNLKNNRNNNTSMLTHIDHVALAVPFGEIKNALSWYCKVLGFLPFDCDEQKDGTLNIYGNEGGLKTVVGTISYEKYSFKIVFVEPIDFEGKKKSQVQEFLDFNGGPGIQHIALYTKNIIETVNKLKNNGIEFIEVPEIYYNDLFQQYPKLISILEQPNKLQELGILVDVAIQNNNENKNELYKLILQTFTVPISDRPTLFLEIINRKGSSGFGSKTIKALFQAVEKLQQQRIKFQI